MLDDAELREQLMDTARSVHVEPPSTSDVISAKRRMLRRSLIGVAVLGVVATIGLSYVAFFSAAAVRPFPVPLIDETTPPAVTAVTPADGSSGVATRVTPTATFSEAMSAATITTSTAQLSGPGGTIAAKVSYDRVARRVTLAPRSPLAGSTAYTMTVRGGASGVADTAGNRLGSDRTWRFTTVAPAPTDTEPPVVSAVAASATAAGVATVTWTTDEPSSSGVDYGSSAASLDKNEAGPVRVTAHSVRVSGLTAGATYFYRVTSVDAAGNSATSPAPPASFIVPTAAAVVEVPDVVSLTLQSALETLEDRDLVGMPANGEGRVIGQDPEPGVPVEPGTVVQLTLDERPPRRGP